MTPTPLVEYELFLPARDGHDQPIDAARLAPLRQELMARFGGLTDTQHRNEGRWRLGPIEIQDEIFIWRVLAEDSVAHEDFMRELRARLEREFAQDEILILKRALRRI